MIRLLLFHFFLLNNIVDTYIDAMLFILLAYFFKTRVADYTCIYLLTHKKLVVGERIMDLLLKILCFYHSPLLFKCQHRTYYLSFLRLYCIVNGYFIENRHFVKQMLF